MKRGGGTKGPAADELAQQGQEHVVGPWDLPVEKHHDEDRHVRQAGTSHFRRA